MATAPPSGRSKAFCRDVSLIEDLSHTLYGTKPTLYSVRDMARLAKESIRARAHSHVVHSPDSDPCCTPPRDFAAFFQSSPNCDPNYCTSHSSPVPVFTRQKVVTAYPLDQSIRWQPYVESSSFEDVTYQRQPVRNCRCKKCSARNRLSRTSSSGSITYGSEKSNITTFNEVYTMTTTLADAACGSSTLPSMCVSELTVTGSDIALGTPAKDYDQFCDHLQCRPHSILKKPRTYRQCNDCDPYESRCNDDHDAKKYYVLGKEVHNDTPSRSSSIWSFFRRRRKKNRKETYTRNVDRRTIYNEGIDGSVKKSTPLPPMGCLVKEPERRCSTLSVKTTKSKAEHRDDNDLENRIPYSHRRSVSKYHRNCQQSGTGAYNLEDEVYQTVPRSPRSPQLAPRTAVWKPIDCFSPPSIKLPRKVLTSHVDVESYMGPRYPTIKPTCLKRTA